MCAINCIPMKKIPETYRKDGYIRRLLYRTNDIALYSMTPVTPFGPAITGYEVVRILRASKERMFPSGYMQHVGDEYLPSSEAWGSLGWSYTCLEDAERKMRCFEA